MELFDEIERNETRPRNESEPTFTYWNLSARKPVEALRRIIQNWFDSYPVDSQKDLRARLRSPVDSQHQAAFWELYLHELLTGMGYSLEAHPTVAGSSNRPDFLAFDRNGPTFYLEATVAGFPPQKVAAAGSRLEEVLDLINKLEDPNFLLQVEYSGLPNTPPPVRALRRSLEEWLRTLDVNYVKTAWRDGDYDKLPVYNWSHDGLTLSFSPIPKSRSYSGDRAIGIVGGEAHWLTTDGDIRAAVLRKASRYGDPSLPMIIAVDFVGDHCDDIDINNALFGSEAFQVVRRSDGQYDLGSGHRLPNGIWFGKSGPRNRRVSAVLIGNLVNPYEVGTTTPLLVHNPYLEDRLDLSSYPLPQSVPDKANQTMRRIEGRSASEFLRLPSPWPPPTD